MKIDLELCRTMVAAGATGEVLLAYLEQQHGKGEKKRVRDRKWRREHKTKPDDQETKRDDSTPTHIELERSYFKRVNDVCGGRAGALAASLLKAKQQDVGAASAVLDAAMKTHDPRGYVAAACRETGENGHRSNSSTGPSPTNADVIVAGMARVAARRGHVPRSAAGPDDGGGLFGSADASGQPPAEPGTARRD
jgi:hypothetical protein